SWQPRAENRGEKYGILNVTELFKRAIDPSNKISEIKLPYTYTYTYITSKGKFFSTDHWTEAYSEMGLVNHRPSYVSHSEEEKYIARLGLKKKVTRYAYGN